tara:strand:- start:919 stop:1266 length:348 start_codon:yes stop_codon:yes gene_type:complete
MSRIKRGTTSLKRRRNVLKEAKGYRFGRSTKERQAKEAVTHAGAHALAHRRKKKRVFRKLWNIKISAGATQEGISYSKLIGALKKKNIELNRKVLSEMAEQKPEAFKEVIEIATK